MGRRKKGGIECRTESRKWREGKKEESSGGERGGSGRGRVKEIIFCILILSNRTERSGQEFPRLDSSNRTSQPEASGKEPHTYVYNPKEYAYFFFIYPTLKRISCNVAFLYVYYSFLLISEKFCDLSLLIWTLYCSAVRKIYCTAVRSEKFTVLGDRVRDVMPLKVKPLGSNFQMQRILLVF